VNGVIGLSGDLSGNCYIQFGTTATTSTAVVDGAIRIARTDPHVLGIQNWIASTSSWQLCNVDLSGLFVSWINGTNTGPAGQGQVQVLSDFIMGGQVGATTYPRNILAFSGGYCYIGSTTQYFAGGYFDYLMPGNATHREIGSSSNKWTDIYCVNTHWGDAYFGNDFRFTEDDDNGVSLYSADGVLMQRWSLSPAKDDIQALHERIALLEEAVAALQTKIG
jgi:hypothetical protein